MTGVFDANSDRSADLYVGGFGHIPQHSAATGAEDDVSFSAIDVLAQRLAKMNKHCRARRACGPKGFRPFR